MVITTHDSDRQRYISELFSQPQMADSFEPPVFSPSVSSRSLRNRFEFFRIANEAGLIPEQEWEAIKAAQESGIYEKHATGLFFHCLNHIPVTEGRHGSQSDVKLHYSCEVRRRNYSGWTNESLCRLTTSFFRIPSYLSASFFQFWYKAKTINRGRSVLACTFAHLIALKSFTEEGFDVLLEDNVRAPLDSCADLVRKAKMASERLEADWGVECHFRFLGWLGSTTNLEYLLGTHSKKRAFYPRDENGESEGGTLASSPSRSSAIFLSTWTIPPKQRLLIKGQLRFPI